MTTLGIAKAAPARAIAWRPYRVLTVASLAGGDVLAVGVAIGIAVAIRHARDSALDVDYWLRLFPLIGVFLIGFVFNGLYPGIALNPVEELRRICRSVTTTYLLLGAATFVSHEAASYSRAVFLISWPLTMMMVASMRRTTRRICCRKPWWGYAAVVFSSGAACRRVIETFENQPELGIRVARVFDAPLSGDDVYNARDRSRYGYRSLAADRAIHYAIVAFPDQDSERLASFLDEYAAQFPHVLIIPDMAGVSSLWVTAKDLNGVLGFEIRQSLALKVPQFIKRALDVAVVVLAAPVLLPLVAVLYAAVRLTSAGGAFYGHRRVGKDGEELTVWKFRPMVEEADLTLKRHLAADPELMAEWNRDRKLRRDPRVTRLGRILRRTSLDELPQLWNVLAGEMSLVGPRPIVSAEVTKYGKQFRLYCAVRPGITGLWQISGRNDTTYADRVSLDKYYVHNWSVWLDIHILSQTARAVFLGAGAY